MERTLILVKPDGVRKRLIGQVVARFEEAGFVVRGCKMMRLEAGLLKQHYAHIADKPFYPEVEQFMMSAPVVALVLEGKRVVERVRELTGPTDSKQAAKGTIRGDFGLDKMANVVHASDSVDAARVEIARFFQPGEIYEY